MTSGIDPFGGDRRSRGWPGRLAGALLAGQALVLVGFASYFLFELTQGEGDDTMRVIMSAVMILLFAAGLGLVARQLWAGAAWTRTAAAVWQVLLLPVGISLIQSRQTLLGAAVLLVSLATVAAVLLDRRPAT